MPTAAVGNGTQSLVGDGFATVNEAAQFLRVSRAKVYLMMDSGELTYAKFGRAILAEPGAKAYQLFDSKVIHLLEPRYSTSDPIKANSLEDLIAQLRFERRWRNKLHTLSQEFPKTSLEAHELE